MDNPVNRTEEVLKPDGRTSDFLNNNNNNVHGLPEQAVGSEVSPVGHASFVKTLTKGGFLHHHEQHPHQTAQELSHQPHLTEHLNIHEKKSRAAAGELNSIQTSTSHSNSTTGFTPQLSHTPLPVEEPLTPTHQSTVAQTEVRSGKTANPSAVCTTTEAQDTFYEGKGSLKGQIKHTLPGHHDDKKVSRQDGLQRTTKHEEQGEPGRAQVTSLADSGHQAIEHQSLHSQSASSLPDQSQRLETTQTFGGRAGDGRNSATDRPRGANTAAKIASAPADPATTTAKSGGAKMGGDPKWRWIVSSAIVFGSIAVALPLLTMSEPSYLALLLFFGVGVCVVLVSTRLRRPDFDHRLFTLRLVRASVALAVAATVIWCMSLIIKNKILPPLPVQWEFLILLVAAVGTLGYGWRVRRKKAVASFDASKTFKPQSNARPPWEDLTENLAADAARQSHLKSLHKIHEEVTSGASNDKIRSVVEEEIIRLQMEAKCAAKEQDKDILDAPASFLEWAVQKLPELAQLDATDLRLAKAVHDIGSLHTTEKNIFVDHRKLLPIHAIDRDTANDKCNQRAEAAKKALHIIKGNGNRLSEALIHSHEELSAFESVNGIQVVNIAEPGQPPEYVTFEGNGRNEALNRAFGGRQAPEGIEVEVREFEFPDEETRKSIREAIRSVRQTKKVAN